MWGDDPPKKPPGLDRQSFDHGAQGKPKGQFDDDAAYHEGRRRAGLADLSWMKNFERRDEPSVQAPPAAPREEAGDGGLIGKLLFLLLCFPIATWFIASSLPLRLADERSDSSVARRVGTWIFAPFYGIGVLSLLTVVWLYPTYTGLLAVTGAQPGESVGAGFVLAVFALLLAMPGWAWLLNRGIDALRQNRPPGQVGPILGLAMNATGLLGVLVVGAVVLGVP